MVGHCRIKFKKLVLALAKINVLLLHRLAARDLTFFNFPRLEALTMSLVHDLGLQNHQNSEPSTVNVADDKMSC